MPRRARLAGDYAETAWTVQIQTWVGRLIVVQHVDELEAQGCADTFTDAYIFRHSQIEIERSETAQNAGASAIGVDPQDQSPEP